MSGRKRIRKKASLADQHDRQQATNNLMAQWSLIAALLDQGARLEKSVIVAALRNATSEIDDLIRLMHDSSAVIAFLQVPPEGLDPDVARFLDKLTALLFRVLPIIPANVQHHLADLIEGKPMMSKKGRPRLTSVRKESEQRRRAGALIATIRRIQRAKGCSQAQAFREYARQHNTKPESVDRNYRRAMATDKRVRAEWNALVEQSARYMPDDYREKYLIPPKP